METEAERRSDFVGHRKKWGGRLGPMPSWWVSLYQFHHSSVLKNKEKALLCKQFPTFPNGFETANHDLGCVIDAKFEGEVGTSGLENSCV